MENVRRRRRSVESGGSFCLGQRRMEKNRRRGQRSRHRQEDYKSDNPV